MYWYLLFVRTGREHSVEQFLRKRLDSKFLPFVPLHEIIYRKSGTSKKETKPLFPGYVFVDSSLSGESFLKNVGSIINANSDIIKLLRYSNTEIALRESERQMLLGLCNKDNCIESSYGIIEGNKVFILEGPLKGLESIVKRVNRHRKQAWIELEIMGDIRLVSVSLEIIRKA